MPAVTSRGKSWPLFHFWHHQFWRKLVTSILNFCWRKRSFPWCPDQRFWFLCMPEPKFRKTRCWWQEGQTVVLQMPFRLYDLYSFWSLFYNFVIDFNFVCAVLIINRLKGQMNRNVDIFSSAILCQWNVKKIYKRKLMRNFSFVSR